MRAIMLTIRLKWFYLTYKGIKTVEVRKTCPKDFVGDVFEVVSKTNFEKDLMEIPENEREFFKQFKGKVGLKFTLNKVEKFDLIEEQKYKGSDNDDILKYNECLRKQREIAEKSCLTISKLVWYCDTKSLGTNQKEMIGYAWHISNLEIFDRPKELSEFRHYNKPHCDSCPFQYSALCEYHIEVECDDIPLTKSPQSWQFIEVD